MAGASADREAFFVGSARLLDVDIAISNRPNDSSRLVRQPAGVRVGDQDVTGFDDVGTGVDAGDVGLDVAPHLQLESSVALVAISLEVRGHCFRVPFRDGSVKHEILAVTAAEQGDQGKSARLAEDVPAGHIDRTLDVGVSLQPGVHRAAQDVEVARVEAD